MFIDVLRKRRKFLFDTMYEIEQENKSVPMNYIQEMRKIVQQLYDMGEPFSY